MDLPNNEVKERDGKENGWRKGEQRDNYSSGKLGR